MKKKRRSFIRIALFLLLIFAAVGPVTERTPGAPGVFLHQAAVPSGPAPIGGAPALFLPGRTDAAVPRALAARRTGPARFARAYAEAPRLRGAAPSAPKTAANAVEEPVVAFVGIIFICSALSAAFAISRERRHQEKVFLTEERYRRTLETEKAALLFERERFEMVYDSISIEIWDYDLKTKTISPTPHAGAPNRLHPIAKNTPESLVAAGFVHPESAEAFLAMHKKLHAGERRASGVFRFRNADGAGYSYERIRYTNLFDENGKPYRAIGMSEDVTEQREKELVYEKWRQSIEKMPPESVMHYEFNLSRGACEREEGALLTNVRGRSDDYAGIVAQFLANVVLEDRVKFIEFFDRNRLLNAYYGGVCEHVMEYRAACADKRTRWLRATAQLVPYPYSVDLKMFLLFEDVDARKKEELLLLSRAEEDPLTGILNRRTFIERVTELLNSEPQGQHALVWVDIDDFKRVNDMLGHTAGDKVLTDIAQNLRSLLRAGDMIGRVGGDEFMICMRNIPFDEVVEKRARLIVKLLQFQPETGVAVSGSLGIAMYPRDGATFEELYGRADAAMYQVKRSGKNDYMFYRPDMESGTGEWKPPAHELHTDIETAEPGGARLRNLFDAGSRVLENLDLAEICRAVLDGYQPILVNWNAETNASSASEEFSEYTLSERPIPELFTKSAVADDVHPDDFDAFEECMRLHRSAGNARVETTLRLKKRDGNYALCRLMVISVTGEAGALLRVVCMIVPLFQQFGPERSRLVELIDQAASGIALFQVGRGLEYTALYISPSFYRMTKRPKETLGERGKNLLGFVLPEDREELMHSIYGGVSSGEVIDCTYRVTEHSGEIGWRRMRALRIPYPDSELPVIVAAVSDITESRKQELALAEEQRRLALESERVRCLFEMSPVAAFEIDPETRTMQVSGAGEARYALGGAEIRGVPDALVQNGFVHADSAAEFKALVEGVLSGGAQGSCVIRGLFTNGQYRLMRVSCRAVLDADGRPARAIGVIEDLNSGNADRLRFLQEEKLRFFCSQDLMLALTVDITRDRIESVYAADGWHAAPESGSAYSAAVGGLLADMAGDEDRALMRGKIGLDALRRCYELGQRYIAVQYHVRSESGRIAWVWHIVRLLIHPESGDLFGFLYIVDCDVQKKRELALPRRVERDTEYGLYTPATFIRLSDHALNWECQNERCALLVLKILDYDVLAARIGGELAVAIARSTIRKLRLALSSRQVLSCLGRGRLAILLTDVEGKAQALERAQEILRLLANPALFCVAEESLAEFRVGVALPGGGAEAMLDAALLALEQGDGAVVFAGETDKTAAPAGTSSAQQARASAAGEALRRDRIEFIGPDDELEHDYAVRRFIEGLTSCADRESAMRFSLSFIGALYGADFAAVYRMREDGTALQGLHAMPGADRWDGVPVPREIGAPFPPCVQSMIEQKGIVVWRGGTGGNAADMPQACAGLNGAVLIPAVAAGEIAGCFFVGNPKSDGERFAASVASLTWSEMQRYDLIEEREWLSSHDRLTRLCNRDCLMRHLQSIRPETLSSLGVAAIDINDLRQVNAEFGPAYGDRIIRRGADVLLELFAPGEVFRYDGGKFYVLAADILREQFADKLQSAERRLAEDFPGRFAFGHIWVRVVGSLEKHLEQADEMLEATKRERQGRSDGQREMVKRRVAELQENLGAGWYFIELQPKVDAVTRCVVGAEALVRMQHPRFGRIMPDKFIPVNELRGTIRYIDLFVMDTVCALLGRRTAAGERALPISLNFSRATLLEPGIADTIAGIAERHGAPRNLISIEITEGFGDMDYETLSRIGGGIRRAGFLLSLDDFGAKFSNLKILSAVRFHEIKIDKSIVDRVLSNTMSRAIIRSMTQLCDQFNIISVAEGVETEEQLAAVRELGCRCAQGYLIDKPVPVPEFETNYLGA